MSKRIEFLKSFIRQAEFRRTNKNELPEVAEEAAMLETYLKGRVSELENTSGRKPQPRRGT